jgi:hypothetical protein
MRRFVRSWMILALLAAAFAPAGAFARQTSGQPAADRELQSELEDVFEVLPLSSGFVLKPHDDDADYRTLEIAADGAVLVDGKTPDESQSLRDLLGGAAYRVLVKVRKLDEAQRRELLSATAEGRELPEAAEAGVAGESPVPAPPAAPAEPGVPVPPAPPVPPRIHSDAKVSVGSGVTVEEDEVVTEDVVAVGGPLTIRGEVQGDATAIGGSAEIDGKVTGEVVVMGGPVTLGPHADIGRDVTSVGGTVKRDPAARVGGKVSEVALGSGDGLGIWRSLRHLRHQGKEDWKDGFEFTPVRHFTRLVVRVLVFIVGALIACLFMLVAKAPMERIERKVDEEPWKAGLVGLVAQIALLPLLVVTCIILAVSIIGIPLLLLVQFALLAIVLLVMLGYCAVCLRIGRWAQDKFNWRAHNDYWMLIMGLALLSSFGILSRALDFGPLSILSVMLAIFGFLLEYAAATVGFGGALLTRFGRGPKIGPPPAITVPASSEPVGPIASEPPVEAAPPPAASEPNPYEGSPWESDTAAEPRPDEPR